MTLSDVLTKKMTAGLPQPSISMTLWGGEGGGRGFIMKRLNEGNYSKIVWRRPLTVLVPLYSVKFGG